jgi:hypothetical protein
MNKPISEMKFSSGQIVVTRGVNDLVADNEEFAKHVQLSLRRHLSGDWGEIDNEDRATNELALLDGERLFSAYKKVGVPPIWIITECDRSVTTVLFPDEY